MMTRWQVSKTRLKIEIWNYDEDKNKKKLKMCETKGLKLKDPIFNLLPEKKKDTPWASTVYSTICNSDFPEYSGTYGYLETGGI